MFDISDIAVFIGLDVGKDEHHAVALDRAGKQLFSKPLPQDEAKLRALIEKYQQAGTVLLVVDQPATIGALPVTVAQACGAVVGYLPGLAMRRIADLHPGEAKTDARDAAIIAEAARTMPHTLRALKTDDETLAALAMLNGFDEDLATSATAVSNRIRGLLTQIHPALERVVGAHLEHRAMVALLQKYPTPAALARAGQPRVGAFLAKSAPRAGKSWAQDVFTALGRQSVVVAGTDTAGLVLPQLAAQLAQLRAQRLKLAADIEGLVDAHPLSKVLMSLPGIGVRTAAVILAEVCGKTFPTAAHLASYAGIAPVTRRSGSSIRGEHPSRRGNKKLKRAFFLAAFAAIKTPLSRAYYDKKRAQGMRHNQALIALARRRCDVIYAMLRDGTLYDEKLPKAA